MSKQIKEIEIHAEEVRELGQKVLSFLASQYDENTMTVKDKLLCVETLSTLKEMMIKQLDEEGVKLDYRREEKA